MTCDGYSCSALMGNWLEERMSFKQQSRMEPNHRVARNKHDINFVTQDSVKPQSRVARSHPWNTKGVVIDRGYKEFESLHKYSYNQERLDHFYNKGDERPLRKDTTLVKNTSVEPTLQTGGANQYKMIGEKNPDQAHVNRKIPMNCSDFGSTLKKHHPDHGKFFGLSTYASAFQDQKNPDAKRDFEKELKIRQMSAGGNPRAETREGIYSSSILIGEQYRDFPDPQYNTQVQRSWVYGVENSMVIADKRANAVLDKMKKPCTADALMARYKREYRGLKGADTHMSLPLENGERNFMPKLDQPGAYRHMTTDVTKIANKSMNYR